MKRLNINQNYGEARKILRERLVRFLPAYSMSKPFPNAQSRPPISDRELVDLYLHLKISPHSDIAWAREVYEQARQAQLMAEADQPNEPTPLSVVEVSHSAEPPEAGAAGTVSISMQVGTLVHSLAGLSPPPTFDELVSRGWILTSWGRFAVPRNIVMAVLRSQDARGNAFRSIVNGRGDNIYTVIEEANLNGPLSELAAGIVRGEYRPGEIVCVSRPWVAARLWDTSLNAGGEQITEDAEQRLSRWVDRWISLGAPPFAASAYLDSESFETFIETAMSVLQPPSTTPNWQEFEQGVTKPEMLLQPDREEPISIDAAPFTTIGREKWLGRGMPQHTVHDYLATRGVAAMSLVLNELEEAHYDSRRIGPRLMELAVERPVLLMLMAQRVQRYPVLLADMLLSPATCTLACSLIASWSFNDGGWFREFQAPANRVTELLAFEDALAVLGGHLDARCVSARDMASLYRHIYEQAANPEQMTRAGELLSLLREELTSATATYYDEVVGELITAVVHSSNPINSFCAALDMLTDSGCVERIEPHQIVTSYLEVIFPRGERITGRELDIQSAQALCSLALRCDEALRNRFLNAIDVRAWMEVGPEIEQESFIFQDRMECRIRLHIRVLSRAIAGWPTEAPRDIVDVLARAIWAGATKNIDRGRIDVFVPGLSFGHSWAQEQPIAQDMSAALMRLTGDALQAVVIQLCQIDEPIVLAGIVAGTPDVIHRQIKQHLLSLTPATAPDVSNLPAAQARVEALLNAGLVEMAAPFVDVQREAQTFGPVPGRETSMLRTNLRLHLLRKDWAAIEAFEVPRNLSDAATREQYDVLQFYKAVAELSKERGNPAAAEAIFIDLMQRNPGVTAYPLNLFASRVHRLLNDNSLRVLTREELTESRRYLTDAVREIRPRIQHAPGELKMLDINRAMLHLAAGQPRQSLDILLSLRDGYPMEHIEGFRALAIARLGALEEAKIALSEAERDFGRTEFLTAIRENIDTHRPYMTAPNFAIDDNPLPAIRHAIAAFHRLGHVEQAQALHSHALFERFLIEEVRGACASLVALVPMMRNLELMGLEDDISGVLKQILRSRLIFPQWAVEDQPRGGYSETGGVGERDFAISKGAAELTVIEALVVRSVDTGTLTSHFKKLLGYGLCRVFFHITYVRNSNCAGVLQFLKTACASPPHAEIEFIRAIDLPDYDSRPMGFEAHYKVQGRDILVVFLALDMGQQIQREAAQKQRQ